MEVPGSNPGQGTDEEHVCFSCMSPWSKWLSHLTFNQEIAGSNPAGDAGSQIFVNIALVMEWQTCCTQNAVPERECGFKSHLGHYISL